MKRTRREINKVRTDHLEKVIAMHLFKGEYEAADAVTRLAQSIGAPIDQAEIESTRKLYMKVDQQP